MHTKHTGSSYDANTFSSGPHIVTCTQMYIDATYTNNMSIQWSNRTSTVSDYPVAKAKLPR